MKYSGLALLATLSLAQVITPSDATAALFQQSEINQDTVIAIASPIGNESHQLLILEQLNSSRECWAVSGDRVNPLLLGFDFTGICSRATDSNGYSLRVGNEDLGLQYTLRLSADNGILRLLASSNRNLTAPPIEIGRALERPGEFVAITLNPGWRITKRNYNGQQLGHYYLSNDQPLSAVQPTWSSTPIAVQPTPSQPEPIPPSEPITIGSEPTPLSPSAPVQPTEQESIPITVEFPDSTPDAPPPSTISQPQPIPPSEPITIGSEPTPLSPSVPIPIEVQPFEPISPPAPVEPDIDIEPDSSPIPIAVQPAPTTAPTAPLAPSSPASSSPYQAIELDQSTVVAIASPVGETDYQLIIVEQLDSTRDCWSQQGDRVNPLLLEFDFFGICDRAAGSSGYSVRVANEDLGFQYGVRLDSDNDTLRLLTSSTRELNAPAIEIGQAPLLSGEVVAVTLNPGWRLTKRSYNGQPIRHYYFTNDQPLNTLQPGQSSPSTTASQPPSVPSPSQPVTSQPTASQPTASQSTASELPPVPVSPTLSITPNAPPVDAASLPTIAVPAVIPGAEPVPLITQPTQSTPTTQSIPLNQAPPLTQSRVLYRVTVPAPTIDIQEQVRAIIPDAFRRTVNGEVEMQVGLFGDRQAAVDIQAQLQREGLNAIIQREP